MHFLKAHRHLIAWVLIIDFVSLIGIQWAPFDPHGSSSVLEIFGLISLLIHLAGYLLSLALGLTEPWLAYPMFFLVALVEWTCIALSIARLRAAIRSTQD